MKLESSVSLSEIAQWLNCPFTGDANALVTGINEIHKVQTGDLTFVDYHKYYEKALKSEASFIIINKKVDCPDGKGLIFSNDPFSDYVKLVRRFRPFEPSLKQFSDTSEVGEGTSIFPGVYLGNQVKIGNNCIIHPNVAVYDYTIIGDNVIIHANSVIGSDAFYFKKRTNEDIYYDKLESCGRTIIENNVEIGACCTIDKGVSGDTIVGEGSKLDNHIHIGHGAVIGKNCLFAAQVGIGGKTTIGNNVILWGQVGISKDLIIGDGAVVLAQSGVGKNLEAGKTYFGSPAEEARAKWKQIASMKNIHELWEHMKASNQV